MCGLTGANPPECLGIGKYGVLVSFSSIPGQVGVTFGNPHPEPPKLVSCAWVHLDAGIGICAHYLIHKFNEALGSATELHDVQLELPIIVRKLNGAIIAVGFGLLGSAYGALIASSIERRS